MAIYVYGLAPNIGQAEWSQMFAAQIGNAPSLDAIGTGLVVSASAGTREVSISSGRAAAVGTLVVVDAAETKTFTANSSGSSRIDLVCLEIDWEGTIATAGSIVVLPGTPGSGAPPSPTRNEGVLWQIPLAQVTVTNGATAIVAANITRSSTDGVAAYTNLPLTGFTHGTPPLAVVLGSGVVEFGGAFSKNTGSIAAGASVSLGILIPEGFRPRRRKELTAVANVGGSSKEVAIRVDENGSALLYNASASTIGNGDPIRVRDTTWLPKVED